MMRKSVQLALQENPNDGVRLDLGNSRTLDWASYRMHWPCEAFRF